MLEYIRQYMGNIGIAEFHFEPCYIEVGKIAQTIYAHNVYYFLVAPSRRVEIASDNAYFNLKTGQVQVSNPEVFTGTIQLRTNDDSDVPVLTEFIRVFT